MKNVLFSFCFIISFFCFSQATKTDSLTVLIQKSSDNLEKAKLLLNRSKSYATIKTIEPQNDALLALALAKKESNVNLQIDAYNQLSGINSRQDQYQEAIDYDLQALSLSEKENYALGKVNSYRNIGRNQKSLGNIKEAIFNTEKAKQIAIDSNLTLEMAGINNILGTIYRTNGQLEMSLQVFDEGISQTKNKKILATLYMNKANTLNELVRLDEAIVYHLKSLKLNEEIKDEKGKIQVYNNLSVLFKRAKQYDKAIYYSHKSLSISKNNNVMSSIATSYDNIATIYDLYNKNDSVVWYHKNAISLFENLNDEKNLARCYHNLGHYYLLHNKLNEAKTNLIIALEKRLKINTAYDIASTKTSLGVLYDKEKQYERAEKILLESKELLKDIATENKEFILIALSDHYKQKGDFENALLLKEAQMQLKDSLLYKNEILDVVNKEHNYIINKKSKEIRIAESFKDKFIKNRIVFSILLFMVFLLALYSFVRWKKSDLESEKITMEKNIIEGEHNQTKDELEKAKKFIIEDYIILKNKTKIYLKELIYIKADDHYLEILTLKKKEYLRGSILEILKELPPNFVQCHRSYIVNKNFIQSINNNEIFLKGNIQVTLSRKFKSYFNA